LYSVSLPYSVGFLSWLYYSKTSDFRYIINPGGIENKHVGSVAVRKAIEQYQPLLTLHGHIHESEGFHYIGKTLSVNPGSAFEIGLLKAFIVDINDEGLIKDYQFITEWINNDN